MKVITTKDAGGTTQVAVEERPREHEGLQMLSNVTTLIQPNEYEGMCDAAGLDRTCAACAQPPTGDNPLVVAGDGFRVHVSHVVAEPDSAYYGAAFSSEVAA